MKNILNLLIFNLSLLPILSAQSVDSINLLLNHKSIQSINIKDVKFNINYQNKSGTTLLMYLCLEGKNKELIRECLENGANILLQDSQGFNSINYITFPSLFENKFQTRHHIKNEKDMEYLIKLFSSYRPSDSVKIYKNAIETYVSFHENVNNKYLLLLLSKILSEFSSLDNLNLLTKNTLNWNSLDSSYFIEFVNDFYNKPISLFNNFVTIKVIEKISKSVIEEFSLFQLKENNCKKLFTNFMIIKSVRGYNDIVVIQINSKNKCLRTSKTDTYKLTFSNNKIISRHFN